jgi:hypothetical protein
MRLKAAYAFHTLAASAVVLAASAAAAPTPAPPPASAATTSASPVAGVARPGTGAPLYSIGAGQHITSGSDLSSAPADSVETEPVEQPPVADSSRVPKAASAGLVINASFDGTITRNANAAAIESAINQAIAAIESLYSDPITVSILFRYSSNEPGGSPMGHAVGQSSYAYYNIDWGSFIQALIADQKTSNDKTANPTLPGAPLSGNVRPTCAGGRAIGLNTPPAVFANGNVGAGGPYDGVITINSSVPVKFSRPVVSNNYDGITVIEHEIDEVLGLGSFIGTGNANLRPQDLFSWSAPNTRNLTANGSRYFSINSGNTNLVNFNQDTKQDTGDWFSEPCPQTHVRVQNAIICEGQGADISANSPEGINLDVIGYDLASAISQAARLVNISTRARVATGDQVLIGGFIVTGGEPKKVLIRALGPSLPLNGDLPNPVLELHNANGGVIATNDDWKIDDGTHQSQEAAIRATGAPPSNDLESALVATLPANSSRYTAIVHGLNDGAGTGEVEIYDLGSGANSELANLSTRGFVGTGDNAMIGGFIARSGDGNGTRVLIRALGPSLGIAGSLQDPTLDFRDANGNRIATNANWKIDDQSHQSQEAAIRATTLAPPDDRESALLQPVAPGNYTVIVTGSNHSTGIALVEVYNIH